MNTKDTILTTIGLLLGVALIINSVILYVNLSVTYLIIELLLAAAFMIVFIGITSVENEPMQKRIVHEHVYTDYQPITRTREELEEISRELDSLNRDINSLQTHIKHIPTEQKKNESAQEILNEIRSMKKEMPKAPKIKTLKKAPLQSKISKAKKAAKKIQPKVQAKKRRKMSEETKRKIAWKMERRKKYAKSDSTIRPEAGTRSKFWVSGFTKADGTKVPGKWRKNSAFKKKN